LGRRPELQIARLDLVHSRPIAARRFSSEASSTAEPCVAATTAAPITIRARVKLWHLTLLEERSLPFMGINVWAAPVAALVTMVIGFLWYSLLFARPWVVLMGWLRSRRQGQARGEVEGCGPDVCPITGGQREKSSRLRQ
jgi:hypothetical protein